jgi:hypothetical protein
MQFASKILSGRDEQIVSPAPVPTGVVADRQLPLSTLRSVFFQTVPALLSKI